MKILLMSSLKENSDNLFFSKKLLYPENAVSNMDAVRATKRTDFHVLGTAVFPTQSVRMSAVLFENSFYEKPLPCSYLANVEIDVFE